MVRYARIRFALRALLLSLILLYSQQSHAFTANGHDVIEAAAYRRLLGEENVARLSMIAGHAFSGKDALDLLIAYRILDKPRGWSGGYEKDPLNTLPIVRNGHLDYVLSRQFEGNSQCFHFMARASDVYWDTTTDPIHHYPHMLYDSAYPRCVAFMTSVFHLILHNALAAHAGDHDVYALMHCIADSYSAAHCERDSSADKTGMRWTILYLKVWEPAAFIPYLFHPWAKPFYDGPWGHKLTEPRDWQYWKDADASNEDETLFHDSSCSSSTNPYQVDDDCLSPRAEEAVSALEDLLVVLAENVLREHLYHGIDTTYEKATWKEYLTTYFAGWKSLDSWNSTVAPIRPLRPDEVEWRPLVHLGLEYHPTFDKVYAQDATLDFNLDIPIALLAPITPGIVLDFGEREYGWFTHSATQPNTSQVLRLGYALAFEFADDFELRTIPFEREYVLTPGHTGETRNLVSFLTLEGIIDRHFWFRVEAPRLSSEGWIKSTSGALNDFGIAFGYSNGWDFGKWFSEHTGEDEPLALQGRNWHVPFMTDHKLDTTQIEAATLGSGMSLSATIIDMNFYPGYNQIFGISAQVLWDRNSGGDRNKGWANGFELDYAPSMTDHASAERSAAVPATVSAGYVLRYYLNPHVAITALPIDYLRCLGSTNGATETQSHPSGKLNWDAETSLGITALLMHTDLTVGLVRISWRDALARASPFYQAWPAQLRIGVNFFVP